MKKTRKRTMVTSICAVLTVITLVSCSSTDQESSNNHANEITVSSENAVTEASIHTQQKSSAFHPVTIVQMADSGQFNAMKELFSEWGLEQTELFADAGEMVEAKDYNVHLNMQSGELSVIEISNLRSAEWRYLFFQQKDNGWKLIDHLDVSGRASHEPSFRLEEFNNGENVWFVLNRLDGYGTGIVEHRETWYGIGEDGLEQQLSYTVDSHNWISSSQTVFSNVTAHVNTVKNVYLNNESESIVEVTYDIAFTDSDIAAYDSEKHAQLFTASRTLRYVWNNESGIFELDPASSEGDESLLTFDPEHIKKHFRAELESLAENASSQQKEWLEKIEYDA